MTREISSSQEHPQFRGIRIEDPALDNKKWKALALGTETIARLRRTEVHGELEKDGPLLVFSNHVHFLDVFALPWLAAHNANRSMRIVSRDTLLDPTIQESVAVLRRLGKLPERKMEEGEEVVLPDPQVTLFKKARANFLKSAGNPIPIHRGEIRPEFIEEVRNTLNDGQMVGMFAQETRSPQNDLSNVRGGPAVLIQRYFPDTPTQIVTMAHLAEPLRRPVMRISEPFSYTELSRDKKLELRAFSNMIKDTMYNQLVQDVPDLKR